MKRRGYEINIFFVWISTVDVALARIRKRVLHGGHNVPEEDVRRRFGRSVRNFLLCYRQLADSWFVFDNSGRPSLVAFEKHREIRIINDDAYNGLMAQHGGNT